MSAQAPPTSEPGPDLPATPKRPILICSLERIALGSSIGSPEDVHFGFNLATGLHDSKTAPSVVVGGLDPERLLRPWSWTEGGLRSLELALFIEREGEQLPPDSRFERLNVRAIFDPAVAAGGEQLWDRLRPLVQRLDDRFAESSLKERRWETEVTEEDGQAAETSRAGRWPASLGELSQLPYPLPQMLGLAGRFCLPKSLLRGLLPTTGRLFAVPVLPRSLTGRELAIVVGGGDRAGGVRFDYRETVTESAEGADQPETRVLASALCNPLVLDVDGKAESPWIQSLEIFVEDWRSHLEQRLAEGLFLAPAFVEAWAVSWQEPGDEPYDVERIHRSLRRLLHKYLGETGWERFGIAAWAEERLPEGTMHRELLPLWRSWIDRISEKLARREPKDPIPKGPTEVLDALRGKLRIDEAVQERDVVETAVREFLEAALGSHFEAARAWCEKSAEALAWNLVPEPVEGGDGAATRAGQTEGITLRVGALAGDPEALDQEDIDSEVSDPLRTWRGVVVLAREVPAGGEGAWRCLNWGVPLLAPVDEDNGPCEVLLDTPLLLPARLAYADGLSQPTVTYDNAPISVPGPLESLGAWRLKSEDESVSNGLNEFVRFSWAPQKIPGLVFGKTYEFAAFRVPNSGVLPEELQHDSPWLLDLSTAKVPDDHVAKVEYKRRVPVGAIRVKAGERTSLGAPERVVPRLPKESDPRLSKAGEGLRPPEDSRPLLFLHADLGGNGNRCETACFELRRPEVDWRSWERWPKVHRKEVLGDYLHAADREQKKIVFDDPAVTGFHVRLYDLDTRLLVDDMKLPLGGVPDDEARAMRGEVLASTLEVALRTNGPWGIEPAGDSGVLVKLAPGHIYRVVVSCEAVGNERYFAEVPSRNRSIWELDAESDELKPSTWELDVEVAEPLFTPGNEKQERKQAAGALWQAIDAHFDESTGVLRCSVNLDRLQLDDPLAERMRRQVLTAEVWRQSWAWRGRPLTPCHPDLRVVPGETCSRVPDDELERYLGWEVSEMGFRGDDNHAVYPMQRSREDEHQFVFTDPLGTGPGRDGDRRAGHHRFAVRLVSRYRALLGSRPSSLVSKEKSTETLWRRRFVPCRWSGDVPPPKVRAVLPLTEDRSVDGEGPKFLVLLDEGWHEIGGLSERLVAQVVEATLPTGAVGKGAEPSEEAACLDFLEANPSGTEREEGDDPPRGHERLAVMGPDPIIFADGYDKGAKVGLTVRPAVGHSREIDSPLPRISSTSFIVQPKLEGADLDWWFLKVRFQREIDVLGQAEPLRSEPTQAYWVQLLPSFRLYREESPQMTARYQKGDGVQICHDDRRNHPAGERRRLVPYLLLTRRMTDALGQDQEVYLGMLWWDELGGAFKPEDGVEGMFTDETAGQLQVRRIEVQQRDPGVVRSGRELWRWLFGTWNTQPAESGEEVAVETFQKEDARARIVRMSDPIPLLDVTVAKEECP